MKVLAMFSRIASAIAAALEAVASPHRIPEILGEEDVTSA
jgi:hypothetical protein